LEGVCLLGLAETAQAVTECSAVPQSAFSDETTGRYHMFLDSGAWAYIDPNDPGYRSTVALFTAALLSEKRVVVRYAADGVSCTTGPQPAIGLWLFRQ
jgi:hypothetical protein